MAVKKNRHGEEMPDWAYYYFVNDKPMNTRQQQAQVKMQQKEQQRLAEIGLRDKCLNMALEYHRGVENKYKHAIDIDALHNIDLGKDKKGKQKTIPASEIVSIFTQTGKLFWKGLRQDGSGDQVRGTPIIELGRSEITIETVLATASRFYNYISQNKLK